jgi:carboxylesterase type B
VTSSRRISRNRTIDYSENRISRRVSRRSKNASACGSIPPLYSAKKNDGRSLETLRFARISICFDGGCRSCKGPAESGAPAFQYYFTWQSPMLEEAGAWHTAELAFCFGNNEALRTGRRQHAGGAGTREKDDYRMGKFRPYRQPQPAGV